MAIWFEQIPDNLQANINLKEDKINEIQLENIQYLTLWHHKKNKLGKFDGFPESLLYLVLLKDKNGGEEFETVIKYGKYETFRYIY